MNWDSILTTLWNKISKPVTNILIGVAFLYFAPSGINWFGWVFLAIGIGNLLDKFVLQIPHLWKNYQKRKKAKEQIEYLTEDEEAVLRMMVAHNKQTMRSTDFENALQKTYPRERTKLHDNIYDAFVSLNDKDLIYYDRGYSGYFKIEADELVWNLIKKRYKKNFNEVNRVNHDQTVSQPSRSTT